MSAEERLAEETKNKVKGTNSARRATNGLSSVLALLGDLWDEAPYIMNTVSSIWMRLFTHSSDEFTHVSDD
jgi:hypothetical protein